MKWIMDNNKLTITAYSVSGQIYDLLENEDGREFIENHILPDMNPPISHVQIKMKTHDGKEVFLTISDKLQAEIK